MSVTVLACVISGSIFLAAGLIARNPTVPAALLLLWESINAFLPGSLKMMSVVFYLQSLCPIEPPPDRSIPPLFPSPGFARPANWSVHGLAGDYGRDDDHPGRERNAGTET